MQDARDTEIPHIGEDTMRRNPPILLLAAFLVSWTAYPAMSAPPGVPRPSAAAPAKSVPALPESTVDLKNEAAMSVSAPLGTDNGVSAASDFVLLGGDNAVLMVLYPVELYANRFWSQPLSAERFSVVSTGMTLRPASLSPVDHAKVRAEGEALRREYRERQREARREAARAEIGTLQEERRRLEERREELDDRIADVERDLADEESRMEWLTGSEDRDIDRSLEEILSLADRRDELQSQRLALSREAPIPRDEIGRLTSEIRRINDRIDAERTTIGNARERKRSARYAFQSRRKEWRQLVADRKRNAGKLEELDGRIRDLAEILQ
ncbi:MAG TPA: hypothetical protein VIS30_03600 [Candidatus Deferrimicrobiaceae bacterium]